jgi:hypothetical protein
MGVWFSDLCLLIDWATIRILIRGFAVSRAESTVLGQQVYGYCMFKNSEEAVIRYPEDRYAGKVAGRSFHHGRFVQRLRQAAASHKTVTLRQGVVKALINGAGSWVMRGLMLLHFSWKVVCGHLSQIKVLAIERRTCLHAHTRARVSGRLQ